MEITRNREIRSREQLTRQGFPFPTLPIAADYTPIKNKALYVLHNSLPRDSAGYASRSHGLMAALNEHGWDIQGVTRFGYPIDLAGAPSLNEVALRESTDGIVYHRLIPEQPGREPKDPLEEYITRYSDALYELALRERPAVIHAASNHWNGLAAVIVAGRLGIPSVYEVRGLWEITEASRNSDWGESGAYRFISRMETEAALGATRVFTITTALKEELVRRGVPPSKITVVPNGVDTARFEPRMRDEALATKWGLSQKTIIGYVGSLVDYEGLHLLLKSAHEIKKERDDFGVLIVGDGPEEKSVKELTKDLELEDIVKFTGRVTPEEVEAFYSIVDICPFPRLPLPVCEMVSPLKPFEAMSLGKAIVASDVAALAEVIDPDVTGLLHEKGSQQSLTAQLTRLLEQPSLRKDLGERASDWVRNERSWRRISQTVATTYEKLIEKPPADEEVINDLIALVRSSTDSQLSSQKFFSFALNRINSRISHRLLIHDALQTRSSKKSLRIAELLAAAGHQSVATYIARHALASANTTPLQEQVNMILSQEHHLRFIDQIRILEWSIASTDDLLAALLELLHQDEDGKPLSPLTPLILHARFPEGDDKLLDSLISISNAFGIQLILDVETTVDERRFNNALMRLSLPSLLVARQRAEFQIIRGYLPHVALPKDIFYGTFRRSTINEISGILWLTYMQGSPVLRLQRTKSREHLVESVRSVLPLTSHEGIFATATSIIARDEATHRYLKRMPAALLALGYYRATEEVITQLGQQGVSEDYEHLCEALFGQGKFEAVPEPNAAWSPSERARKIISESSAATRMLNVLNSESTSSLNPIPSRQQNGSLKVVSLLHASAPDQTGGYANRAHALLRSLSGHGIVVKAYTRPGFPNYELEPGATERKEHDGVEYYRLGSASLRESGEYLYMEESIREYRRILEDERPDVVHLRSTYVSALPGLIAAKQLGLPTLYEVSGMWELVYASYDDARREGLRVRTTRLENAVLNHADRIVTLTGAMAQEIGSRVKTKAEIGIVPNAVDLSRFAPKPARTDLKAHLGWSKDIPVIGYAGSLVDYEGLDLLLKAARQLKTKGLQFRVLIIGDGVMRPKLEALAEKLEISDVVWFLGRLPHRQVEDYYSIFDVCAFPRYSTPATRAVTPLKPFEALASEKALIVSDVPALQEISGRDNSRGLVVANNDWLALSEALETLITNPELRMLMASRGREWVIQNHSWKKVSSLFAKALLDAASVNSDSAA